MVSLGSWRRELPEELPDWEEVLADLRELRRSTLPTAGQKKVPFSAGPSSLGCMQLQSLLACIRRPSRLDCSLAKDALALFPGPLGGPETSLARPFLAVAHYRQGALARLSAYGRCGLSVPAVYYFLAWSFEKPEGDASEPRIAYEKACS